MNRPSVCSRTIRDCKCGDNHQLRLCGRGHGHRTILRPAQRVSHADHSCHTLSCRTHTLRHNIPDNSRSPHSTRDSSRRRMDCTRSNPSRSDTVSTGRDGHSARDCPNRSSKRDWIDRNPNHHKTGRTRRGRKMDRNSYTWRHRIWRNTDDSACRCIAHPQSSGPRPRCLPPPSRIP